MYHTFFNCQADLAETSNFLELPAASKEHDQFTILSLIVKGEREPKTGFAPATFTLQK